MTVGLVQVDPAVKISNTVVNVKYTGNQVLNMVCISTTVNNYLFPRALDLSSV